ERRRSGAAEAAVGRSAARPRRLHGHHWPGGQRGARKRVAGQGRPQTMDGQDAPQPRRVHEPGRPSAWRRRRQDFGWAPSGDAVGPAQRGVETAQQQPQGEMAGAPEGAEEKRDSTLAVAGEKGKGDAAKRREAMAYAN